MNSGLSPVEVAAGGVDELLIGRNGNEYGCFEFRYVSSKSTN